MWDTDTNIHTDPHEIVKILANYRQTVFDLKVTDKTLRDKWLGRMRGKSELTSDDLRPTLDDVKYVLSHLPSLSPGLDGISFLCVQAISGTCRSDILQCVPGDVGW